VPPGGPTCAKLADSCIDGQCIGNSDGIACDDGDACTTGETCQAEVCSDGASVCQCESNGDCAAFEDGDLCNGTLLCDLEAHKCVLNAAAVVTCSEDGNPCTTAACDGKTGVCMQKPVAGVIPCEADGSPCTPDACDGKGNCAVGPNTCDCQKDADCAAKDTPSVCDGSLDCHKDGVLSKCKVNPATVVECSTFADSACVKATCDDATGVCTPKAVSDDAAFDDGEVCTVGEVCKGGSCLGGTNTCVCASDADCAAKEDGNVCNGTLFCNLAFGTCQVNPASVPSCPSVDDTACNARAPATPIASARTTATCAMARSTAIRAPRRAA
jgi:hypothetical protein